MITLEKAKALKKAGWDDDTEFIWALSENRKKWMVVYNSESYFVGSNAGYTKINEKPTMYISESCSGNEYSNDDPIIDSYLAPSAEEILQKLPPVTIKMVCHKGGVKLIEIRNMDGDVLFLSAVDSTLANVLADFYLSQHNLL